jgi:hypothetical protein
MKLRFYLITNYILITGVLLFLFNTPIFAVNIKPSFHNYSKEAVLEYFLNYPFSEYDDIIKIHEQLHLFPLLIKNFPNNLEEQSLLTEVSAFTSTVPENGDQLSLVIFATSRDKALKRLRQEIHLLPPKGGAILRVYQTKEFMPLSIRSLFQGQIQGITKWCRFIAINAENKSPDELEDIISHELVHAYVSSYLGVNYNNLPKWFNEGIALYLSGSKDQYIMPLGFNRQLISSVSKEYEEYRLVFRFLNYRLGPRGVAKFIHQVIRQRTVNASLNEAIGLGSFESLHDKALQWQSQQQNKIMMIFTVCFGLALFWGGWSLYRRQLNIRNQAQKQAEAAKETVRIYDQQIMEEVQQITATVSSEKLTSAHYKINRATEKKALAIVAEGCALAQIGQRQDAIKLFEEALQIAGWSPKVVDSVQQARDELNGIIL